MVKNLGENKICSWVYQGNMRRSQRAPKPVTRYEPVEEVMDDSSGEEKEEEEEEEQEEVEVGDKSEKKATAEEGAGDEEEDGSGEDDGSDCTPGPDDEYEKDSFVVSTDEEDEDYEEEEEESASEGESDDSGTPPPKKKKKMVLDDDDDDTVEDAPVADICPDATLLENALTDIMLKHVPGDKAHKARCARLYKFLLVESRKTGDQEAVQFLSCITSVDAHCLLLTLFDEAVVHYTQNPAMLEKLIKQYERYPVA